jgi:hypothetical protein
MPKPIIDEELQTRLDDADLIDAIIEDSCETPYASEPIKNRAAFNALPRDEQITLQLSFIQPLPMRTNLEDVIKDMEALEKRVQHYLELES